MRCPNCNSVISDDINFCNYCGENLHKENTVNNTVITNQQTTTVDEDYIKAYVGKNYDDIKEKNFNIFAFFFTQYYVLYRKQYKFFGILMLVSVLSIFLGALSGFIAIGIQIYMGMKFNELYLNEVEKDIKSIQNNNQGKTKEEIINLCSQKGGTTMLYTGILIAVQTVLIAILVILSILFIVAVGNSTDSGSFDFNNFNTTDYSFYDNEI